MTRRIALLVNPTSGKGRGGRLLEPVAERLRGSGVDVDVVIGRDADEAFDRVRDRVAAGVDGVVAVGGDGLVNMALQVVAGTDVPLGVVPAGTGNDIARALGLPLDDPVAAVDLVVARRDPRRSTWAGPTAGGSPACWGPGFDSMVNERANRMSWPQRPQPLQPRDPRRAAHLPAGAVRARARRRAVGDRGDAGGGRQRRRPTAAACGSARTPGSTTGCSTSPCSGPISKPEFLRVFPTVYKGTHVRHPAVTVRRARTCHPDLARCHGLRRRRAGRPCCR